ncbi:MAG: hypothetical protein NUV68_02715 [Caldiserica bacterium]|nr:hypothetical protein [Caldisericota bacterium]MDH7562543.1 hypothetical protein [Caldisericota bacterium]
MKIAVVFSPPREGEESEEYDPPEHAARIALAISRNGYEPLIFSDLEVFENPRILKDFQVNLVFNIAEGTIGMEDREAIIPAICTAMGIKFLGTGVLGSAICLDKSMTNAVLKANGIPVPEWVLVKSPRDLKGIKLPLPAIVKFNNEGSSMGIGPLSVCQTEEEVIDQAFRLWGKLKEPLLIQRFILGREVNAGLIGNPPDWVELGVLALEYKNPWNITMEGSFSEGEGEHCYPEKELASRALKLTKKIFQALRLHDMVRVDFKVYKGELYAIDINQYPALAEGRMFSRLAYSIGLNYDQMIGKIIEAGIDRLFPEKRLQRVVSMDHYLLGTRANI